MGVIEERLAALEAELPPRTEHQFVRTGLPVGGHTCTVCGGWISGFKKPELYKEGCEGPVQLWLKARTPCL